MANILYKTKEGRDPTGLQKVWLCVHPDEKDTYIEKMAETLFSVVSCSLWYDEEPLSTYDGAVLGEDLSRMQLFVMPVTERLLCEESRALSFELPFALSHHIPVLPLMEDEALATLFNEKCGNIQYLCPTQKDTSGLSYTEKLEKFLSSVLLGDELASKVRGAFDAYIFLSYRKKDRRYAGDLMRLIHKNEFCRDIAIWYDEFLTPGENFDEAIAAAMQKSALFALAVTPSLLEENNYVLTKEYPMARERGMRVLPAELVETDRADLNKKFPDLPSLADAYDGASLSPALAEALSHVAKRENDADPTHNFFIGLAYLGGIDVETDRERGLSLITGSAEAGLPEAVEKLIVMYKNGEGVKIDREKAAFWRERLIAIREKEYEEKKDADTFARYADAIRNLAQEYSQDKAFDKAEKAYLRLLSVVEAAFGRFEGKPEGRYVEYLGRLGGVFADQGKFERATEFYEKQVEEAERYSLGGGENGKLKVAKAYVRYAKALLDSGRYAEVPEWEKKIEATLTEIAEGDTESEKVVRILENCYNILAQMALISNKLERALALGYKSKEWSEKGFRFYSAARVAEESCINHGFLGSVLTRMQGREEEAKAHREKALGYAEEYAAHDGSLRAKEFLARTRADMGVSAMNEKNYSDARELLEAALDVFVSVSDRTHSYFSSACRSTVLGHLAALAREEGNGEEEKRALEERVAFLEAELARQEGALFRGNLALALHSRAGFYRRLKNVGAAIADYEKAIEMSKISFEARKDDRYLVLAAMYQKTLADYALEVGRDAYAAEAHREALALFLRIGKPGAYHKKMIALLRCTVAREEADRETAISLYEEAIAACDAYLAENPTDADMKKTRGEAAEALQKLVIEEDEEDSVDALLEELLGEIFGEEQ